MSVQPSSDAGDSARVFSAIWELFERGVLIPQCAWCDRLLIEDAWVHPPPAAVAAVDARMTMSHTICPHCVDASAGGSALSRRLRR